MSRPKSALPPYLTSGAASRAHHALLVKLQAASEQEQGDIISSEVRRIKLALSAKDTSMSKLAEHLLILLHIAATRKRTGDDLDFALVPALQLAEGGKTLKERRLGYLYLSERLPPGHELNLMLVNTVRKDLASQTPSHVLLALHTIIKLPAPEVVPAVTPILVSSALLKHSEPAVRQRTLEALQVLHLDGPRQQTGTAGPSGSKPTFPLSMSKITRLLDKEKDPAVAAALFGLVSQIIKTGAHGLTSEVERLFLVEQVDRTLDRVGLGCTRQGTRDAIRCLGIFVDQAGPEAQEAAVDILLRLLRKDPNAKATLLDMCSIASCISSKRLTDVLFARIRDLLSGPSPSQDGATSSSNGHGANSRGPGPNDHILALRCLDALKKESWAGRLGETDMAVLMDGMNSPDCTIRRATLRLLHEADPSLTQSAFRALIDSLSNASDLFLPLDIAADTPVEQKTRAGIDETARRCLEIAEIRMKVDIALGRLETTGIGTAYAGEVGSALEAWTTAQQVTGDPGYQVWDEGIAIVMDVLRDVPEELSSAASRGLLSANGSTGPDPAPPTKQLLACEACAAFTGHSETEAREVITALMASASSSTGLLRDQALVAAVAVMGNCGQVGVRERITQAMLADLGEPAISKADHRNSRRADQLRFLLERHLSDDVFDEATSRALPDLALAIDSVHARRSAALRRGGEKRSEQEEGEEWAPRPRDLTASRLRYDAYDAPPR